MGERVIVPIKGGVTTPETFCAMLLQHADEMDHVACVVQWKSGDTEVFQTQMSSQDVAWLRYIFEQEFHTDAG